MINILLVDDDKSSHFYHKIMMEESNMVINKLTECYNVDCAINYLEQCIEDSESNNFPDLILVDLNMPLKTGWDFIEEYSGLAKKNKKATIYIVSNSENSNDLAKADNDPEIAGFIPKFVEVDFFNSFFEGRRSTN